MRLAISTALFALFVLLSIVHVGESVDFVEIRGQVATGDFEWNAQNFAGFYYDIDDDLGTEKIITTITEGNKLQEPNGIAYTTTVQKNDFDYAEWGFFNVIGFQANAYFAGYVNDENVDDANELLFRESADENSLSDEQLEAILKDDDTEMTVTFGTPLKLEEGYELSIKAIDIDGNKVTIELSKDGSLVDSKVISPSKDNPTMAEKTYYYRKNVGNQKDLVIIAVHFKNAFRGADTDLATVDGIWQISEEAAEVKVDTEYDKMRIASVSADTITMDNKNNTVTLSKNKDINLMGDVKIITSDQDAVDDANPQRYYIAKVITEPGTYEIRGQVATGDFEWNAQNFAGFYYDIDDDLGTEKIITTITEGNKLQESNGIVYTTTAQKNDFDYAEWGFFNVIGFQANAYFAGYVNDENVDDANELLFRESADENSLSDGQLEAISNTFSTTYCSAGAALAVGREAFSRAVTAAIAAHPNIKVRREEVTAIPQGVATIIASGPLTSAPLAEAIRALAGQDSLYFFDAMAPIVTAESIDMAVAWRGNRWDKRAEGQESGGAGERGSTGAEERTREVEGGTASFVDFQPSSLSTSSFFVAR